MLNPFRWRLVSRGLWIAGGLGAVAVLWFLTLPVPIGWALRLAESAQAKAGASIRLELRSADFRWRLGHNDCVVTIGGPVLLSGGRPVASADEVTVEIPKADIYSRHFSVGRILLKGATATIDLAGTVHSPPPRPAFGSGSDAGFRALAGLLPASGRRSVLIADGLHVRVRLATGDAPVRLPGVMIALSSPRTGRLHGELSLEIGADRRAPQIRAGFDANADDATLAFSLQAPAFAITDFLTFPGKSWLRATVATDLKGSYDLAHGILQGISGDIRIVDGSVELPNARTPIGIPLIEVRGFADSRTGKAHLDTGRLRLGGAELNVSRLDATLGPHPTFEWSATLNGVEGSLLREVAAEVPTLRSDRVELLGDVAQMNAALEGKANLARDDQGRWIYRSFEASAHVGARIGRQDVAFDGHATEKGDGAPILFRATFSPLRLEALPGRWRAAFGLGAAELTINLSADATVAPSGTDMRIGVDIGTGPGHLAPLLPGYPPLAVKTIAARAETDHPGGNWRIPRLRIVAAAGPTLDLSEADIAFGAGQLVAKGTLRLEGLRGADAEPWLSPPSKAALARYRLAPGDLTLGEVLGASEIDQPIVARTTLRAALGRGLTGLETKLSWGPGRLIVRSTPQRTVPIERFSAEARYDAGAGEFELLDLDFSSGGARIRIPEARCSLSASGRTTGRLLVDNWPLAPIATLTADPPTPGKQASPRPLVRRGSLEHVEIEWGATLKAGPPMGWALDSLRGTGRLTGLEAEVPQAPVPLQVRDLSLDLNYPEATLTASGCAMGGVILTTARVDASGLGTPKASIAASAHYAIDLATAAHLSPSAAALPLEGTAEGEVGVSGLVGGNALKATLKADLRNVRLSMPGAPPVLPDGLEAAVDLSDWNLPGAAPTARFTAQTSRWFGQELSLAGRVAIPSDDRQPVDLEITKADYGATSLQASFHRSPAGTRILSVTGTRLDAAPWLRAAVAIGDAIPAPKAGAAPVRPLGAEARAVAGSPAALEADIRIDEIATGPGETARDLRARAIWTAEGPVALSLDALSGPGRRLHADLSGPDNRRVVRLEIEDVAAWARQGAAPWPDAAKLTGTVSQRIAQLAAIPATISGGNLVAEATLEPGAKAWFRARIALDHAVLVSAPRVLNLLAMKSRRALETAPAVEHLGLEDITVEQAQVRVGRIDIQGSGFVDKLKVDHAACTLADRQLHVDGSFFGIGYEVAGTVADPQVYLKDNALLKAIGRPNEFEFGKP
jgi:hypothetical protein